jgi:lysylphosphatidylglycerol synthetase-like protein (DUF2156 family)
MDRRQAVKDFGEGDLIAYATLQGGLRHLETSFGYWSYHRAGGMDITLGGPICAPGDRAEMVRRFLGHSRRPILFYLREPLLEDLEGSGLRCAGLGTDRNADTAALLARPGKEVRSACRKAVRAGIALEEVSVGSLSPSLRQSVAAINRQYLAKAECTVEMRFLNAPFRLREDGMRRFFLLTYRGREQNGVFGFAAINPIFNKGAIGGYLLDVLRFEQTKVWGVWLSTVYTLAELLEKEGRSLSLGFCPLHQVRHPRIGGSRALRYQVDWMARHFSAAQYLRRLRELKAMIPGKDEQRYFASHTRLAPATLYALMEAMGMGFRYLFGPDLLRVVREGWRKDAALVKP